MRSHFSPPIFNTDTSSVSQGIRRSHFLMHSAAIACAISGAVAMLPADTYGSVVANDVATDPTYGSGWSAGQNGGFGFGAWSFNGTDPTPAGTYQGMTSSSAIGTAWTLFTHDNSTGLANAGRAINGGLVAGETFETVIQNPTPFVFFRGFDILFTSGPDNNAPGNNAASLRLSVFNYYNQNWNINDAGGGTDTGFNSGAGGTGTAGMRLDLT